MLAILFRSVDFRAPKDLHIIWFSNHVTYMIPDDGYSRNVSCALKWISIRRSFIVCYFVLFSFGHCVVFKLFLLHIGRFLFWYLIRSLIKFYSFHHKSTSSRHVLVPNLFTLEYQQSEWKLDHRFQQMWLFMGKWSILTLLSSMCLLAK